MSINRPAEPMNVVQKVEDYVDGELRSAEKYENRSPLDDSGLFALHRLAAEIYQLGFNDGESAEHERSRRRRTR